MRYKNLLALHYIHDPIPSLKSAVAMAKNMRAHLDILVIYSLPSAWSLTQIDPTEIDRSQSIKHMLLETAGAVKDVSQWVSGKEVNVDVISSCQSMDMIEREVSNMALYADLVLYHRCDQSLVNGVMAKALEGAIFDVSKPALIFNTQPDRVGDEFKHISIAWDPTPEAMKAVTACLPVLKRATAVEILIIAKPESKDGRDPSPSPIQSWLADHDVDAHITVLPQSEESVSYTLLQYINESTSDLFVMGAYGHSRFSERLFGGVTRAIQDKSEKSLFIAH